VIDILQLVATLPCLSVAALLVEAKACCVAVLRPAEAISGENWLYICFVVSSAHCGWSGSHASIDTVNSIWLDGVAVPVDDITFTNYHPDCVNRASALVRSNPLLLAAKVLAHRNDVASLITKDGIPESECATK
jgi:hypothetical protein